MSEVIYGCTIECVANCRALLDWVKGKGALCAEARDTCWLLAHCDDGVVWGKRGRNQGGWELSHVPFPNISPRLSEENLQQIRLFGSQREVLIWRTDNGFRGRVLADTDRITEKSLRPKVEMHILVGNRLLKGPVDGFSLIGDARGTRHAVPIVCHANDFRVGERTRWPLRMKIRHYLTQEEDTGIVRIAASRLVDLTKEHK